MAFLIIPRSEAFSLDVWDNRSCMLLLLLLWPIDDDGDNAAATAAVAAADDDFDDFNGDLDEEDLFDLDFLTALPVFSTSLGK